MHKNKKLLITGSSGYIGSYFINKYKSYYNIETFSFFNDDLNKLDLSSVDVVLHLSALVHQMGGATKEEYERINVTQTLQLAQKAKEHKVKQFVFMSSVKVYGEETDIKYTEESICQPKDEYGKSKLKAEHELLQLEDKNFKVSIIRTPIVYGKGVKANIKSLVNLIKKMPILPFGSIDNNRSMVYIGNLCNMINEIIEQEQSGIFLASDDKPISTSIFIELISKSLGKKTYLVKIPFFEAAIKLLKPSFHKRLFGNLEVDNKITRERLNLQNPYSLEDGIEFMIKGESV
jgi:nucleoside-diphosphate-sugar epimerase